jgi:hypothetical protein
LWTTVSGERTKISARQASMWPYPETSHIIRRWHYV